MGNPSKNPYNKSDSISYMVRDLPPGGRDQNNFSPFRLFRGNGSWCRISRIQSPSHHIISELKSSPPKPSEVSSKIFLPVIRKKPGCGRPVLPSASSEALGQEESSNPQRISKKMGDLGIIKGSRKKWASGNQEKTILGCRVEYEIFSACDPEKTRLRPTGITVSFI